VSRYPQDTPAQRHSSDGPYVDDDIANQLYQHYFQRLLAVATTRYRWVGLGAHIDPMRVEWLLVTKGLCAFTFVNQSAGEPTGQLFGDPNYDGAMEIYSGRFAVTQAQVTGFLDDTYTPSSYRTFAPTGANGIAFNTFAPLEQWKGVPIWGDANRSQYDLMTIITFARRLAQASLVVDTNMRMTMRGAVIAATQDSLKTKQVALEGTMRGIDVFVTDEAIIRDLKAIDLGVHPDTVEKSHIVAMRIWSEALEALGVESPAQEKSERLVVAELGADNSQVAAVRRLTLTPRRQAASLINRRFFAGAPVVEVVDQWD
jgi:hypothetical protein